jgi:hypothetical protein
VAPNSHQPISDPSPVPVLAPTLASHSSLLSRSSLVNTLCALSHELLRSAGLGRKGRRLRGGRLSSITSTGYDHQLDFPVFLGLELVLDARYGSNVQTDLDDTKPHIGT